jgi:outer membrane protein OmpA-like peptidoglycan-associated protein
MISTKITLFALMTTLKKLGCFLLLSLGAISSLQAQPEAAIWYFGSKAGLDFRQTPPKPLKDGQMNNTEGGTSICDDKGNLLFYTDGIKVWNKNHAIMDNGVNLVGNPSATQSGVIVPLPKQKNKFYVFTLDAEAGPNGFCYSIVDMTASNGLGAVTEKNIPILKPATEKLTAVAHANNKDIWILIHAWNSNAFHAYLLTEKGLEYTPVISEVGEKHGGDVGNTVGCMKVSPDGKKLAVAVKKDAFVEIFDFNNATGKVESPIFIKFESQNADVLMYGVEFSSDNSKLYVSAGGAHEIYQLNLRAGSREDIIKSLHLVGRNGAWTGCLQLAPDGKIYVAVFGLPYLSVIKYPNRAGDSCEYQEKGIYLEGATSNLNLPTFIQTFFDDRENLSSIHTNSGGFTKLGETFYKNILFDFDKYDIRPENRQELDDLVNYLKLSPHIKIYIAGHTDSDGTPEKNYLLSVNRATAVANYLIDRGINRTRLKTEGFGLTKPVAPNTTPEGKAKNRRIEFTLSK